MEKSEFLVESPPKPARKVRRKPVSKRERGIDPACHDGQFVMPREAYNNTPLVIGICQLSVEVYNRTADLKIAKTSCETVMNGTEGAMRRAMQLVCTFLNKQIHLARSAGFNHRNYILEVEEGKPVNEPLNWARD